MATVWVSNTSDRVDTAADHPGDRWQKVGVIDTRAQSDFYTHIQQYIGVRSTTRGKPEFYLHGIPDNAWVLQATADPAALPRFWMLINPYDSGQIHYSSGSIKYLLCAGKPAVVNGLIPRPVEPHPGLLVKPVTLAIKLKRHAGALFIPQYTP
ncbi:hypothetical protein [Mycobacteroides abscessus]|uniref:hypothetical protein n=1 Tax=Mycobacteroides abscessus TaxID=36809 RepID=UPI001F171F4B|nr:hypothetical protein [Mycobacteroides abscessus]